MVAGGVCSSATPTQFNVKFMWVFDADRNQYPGWPIDVSDDEDFLNTSYEFTLPAPGGGSYRLNVIDTEKTA